MNRIFPHTLLLTAALALTACAAVDADDTTAVDGPTFAATTSQELLSTDGACGSWLDSVWVDGVGVTAEYQAATFDGGIDFAFEGRRDWTISELRFWAGLEADFPLTSTYEADIDAFPYAFTFDPTAATFGFTFEYPETVACDATFKGAVYFALEGPGGETRSGTQFIGLTRCACEPPPEEPTGCTLTQGYWKNHYDGAPGGRDVAWPISESTDLCGDDWLSILETPTGGSAWLILAHQWIAAQLNTESGASIPTEVLDALDAGEALLSTCGDLSGDDRATAIAAAATLDAYNNGIIGPGHCD